MSSPPRTSPVGRTLRPSLEIFPVIPLTEASSPLLARHPRAARRTSEATSRRVRLGPVLLRPALGTLANRIT
jgi:hypothetical protein